jgi:hypothetical protein
MQSLYNGVSSRITMKEMTGFDYGDIKNFSIPFNLFYLMSSSGDVSDLSIDIFGNIIWVKADCYSFKYELTTEPTKIDYDVKSEPVFIMNTEDGFTMIDKLNKINATEIPTLIEYEKISDGIADFIVHVQDRMTIYIRSVLATLSDSKIVFDGNLFYDIFANSGVDAISINKIDDDTLYISYENGYMYKDVIYSHNQFVEYRKSRLTR